MNKLAWSLLAAATVFTATVDARAWCRTTTCKDGDPSCQKDPETQCPVDGNPLTWQHMPLTFRFYGRPAQLLREEARAAIRSAFYTWSDTLCGADQRRTSLRFVEGEDLTEDKPLVVGARGSEPFGIYFRDTGWPYTDNADSTLAQTNSFFGKTSGVIEYSDIEINTGYTGIQKITTDPDTEPGADLQAVLTHEVGHFIGLAHSEASKSIMVKSYCGDNDRCERGTIAARRLAADDIDAVCTLYPPDQVLPTEDDAPKTRACSAPGTATPALPPYATAALGIAALAILRSFRLRGRPR
jgi:hypothetical protein